MSNTSAYEYELARLYIVLSNAKQSMASNGNNKNVSDYLSLIRDTENEIIALEEKIRSMRR